MNFQNLHNKKGFSIGEVMISSFLLLVGIVAATALIVSNMRVSFDARDTIIAAQLAQEGIEIVHNVRDTNTAKYTYCTREECTPSDLEPFDSFYNGENHYYIKGYDDDTKSFNLKRSNQDNELQLLIDENNQYVYTANNSGDPTRFYRRIIIDYDNNGTTNDPDDDSAIVHSLVSWDGSAPPDDIENCTTDSRCAYAQGTLSGWLTS